MLQDQGPRLWLPNIPEQHQGVSTLTTSRGGVTKVCPSYINSNTSKNSKNSPHSCASHRAIHKNECAKFHDEYRRLARMVVGPPANIKGHHRGMTGWNSEVQVLWDYPGLQRCFVTCITWILTFAMLQLCSRNGGPAGIRNGTWENHGKLSDQPSIENWMAEAAAFDPWMQLKRDLNPVAHWIWCMVFISLLCTFSSSDGPQGRTYHVANLKKNAGENLILLCRAH